MNRVVHFEISADNIEAAAEFYREVFEWKLEPCGPPEFGYMHIATGDADSPGIDGGILKIKKWGRQIIRDKYQIPGFGWLLTRPEHASACCEK